MVEIYNTLKKCLDEDKLAVMATVVAGSNLGSKMLVFPDGRTLGELGNPDLSLQVASYSKEVLNSQESGIATFKVSDQLVDVFFDVFLPKQRLIIVGAVHIAIPLVKIAKVVGFHTIVIDARAVYANQERFPHADELIKKWPSDALEELDINEATYIVTLTHDEKLDNPALEVAVKSRARYIGALGSKKTHAKRVDRLKQAGLNATDLARIHAPIGLDIDAISPAEIAVAIMGEITKVLRQKADAA